MADLRIWLWLALLLASALRAAEPPIPLQRELIIAGESLAIDAVLRLGAGADGATLVTAQVDLAPMLPILRSALRKRLPQDPCQRQGIENWVGELRRLNLRVDEDWLLLEIEVDAELWACVDVHRSQLRRPLSHGSMRLLLPLRVSVDDQRLRLRVDRPQIGVRGPLGNAAQAWFALRGEELGDALARRAREIDAKGLALPLPAPWQGLGKLQSARFRDSGRPSLELEVQLRPQLPGWAARLLPFAP